MAVVGAGEIGSGLTPALGLLPSDRRPAKVIVVDRDRELPRLLAGAAPLLIVEAAGTGTLANVRAAADVAFTAVEA